MASVSQVECSLKHIMEERANVLAMRQAVLSDRENLAARTCYKRFTQACAHFIHTILGR